MKPLMTFASVLLLATFAQAAPRFEIQAQGNQFRTNDNAQQQRTIDRYSYNFGRVWLNTVSYASYRLTNTGTTPLTFQQATISGGNYSATHSCTGLLAPNAVCQFDIRFSPFMEGLSAGRFILSFVEDLDIVVDVWGEGYRM